MRSGITPRVTVEILDPADLLSAIQAQPIPTHRSCVALRPTGIGHQSLLAWALTDIKEAKAATGADQQRHATNAVLNARRALSCLVDEFLARDGFNHCKDAPTTADRKAKVLLRRQIFDDLANSALVRAIGKRDLAEHNFQALSLAEAEDIVHVVRASLEATIALHSPYKGTALVGSVSGGKAGPFGNIDQMQFWFDGWSGVALAIVRETQPAWFGVIIPSSDVDAVVRKVELRAVTCDVWNEVLTLLDTAQICSYESQKLWLGDLKAYGLI